jgi:hypothetical protein
MGVTRFTKNLSKELAIPRCYKFLEAPARSRRIAINTFDSRDDSHG